MADLSEIPLRIRVGSFFFSISCRDHREEAAIDMNKLFLDKPHTEKELDHGESFGFALMQGWRASAEDFHKHLIPFDSGSWKLWSYFAIFDGHNGRII